MSIINEQSQNIHTWGTPEGIEYTFSITLGDTPVPVDISTVNALLTNVIWPSKKNLITQEAFNHAVNNLNHTTLLDITFTGEEIDLKVLGESIDNTNESSQVAQQIQTYMEKTGYQLIKASIPEELEDKESLPEIPTSKRRIFHLPSFDFSAQFAKVGAMFQGLRNWWTNLKWPEFNCMGGSSETRSSTSSQAGFNITPHPKHHGFANKSKTDCFLIADLQMILNNDEWMEWATSGDDADLTDLITSEGEEEASLIINQREIWKTIAKYHNDGTLHDNIGQIRELIVRLAPENSNLKNISQGQQDAAEILEFLVNLLPEKYRVYTATTKGDRNPEFAFSPNIKIPLNKTIGSYFNTTHTIDIQKQDDNGNSIPLTDANGMPLLDDQKQPTYKMEQVVEQTILLNAPPTLTVQLIRFNNERVKNGINTIERVDTSYNIEQQFTAQREDGYITYYLTSITSHINDGNAKSVKSGHYVNYKKIEGNWFKFDDNHPVIQMTEQKVLEETAQNCYILNYSQNPKIENNQIEIQNIANNALYPQTNLVQQNIVETKNDTLTDEELINELIEQTQTLTNSLTNLNRTSLTPHLVQAEKLLNALTKKTEIDNELTEIISELKQNKNINNITPTILLDCYADLLEKIIKNEIKENQPESVKTIIKILKNYNFKTNNKELKAIAINFTIRSPAIMTEGLQKSIQNESNEIAIMIIEELQGQALLKQTLEIAVEKHNLIIVQLLLEKKASPKMALPMAVEHAAARNDISLVKAILTTPELIEDDTMVRAFQMAVQLKSKELAGLILPFVLTRNLALQYALEMSIKDQDIVKMIFTLSPNPLKEDDLKYALLMALKDEFAHNPLRDEKETDFFKLEDKRAFILQVIEYLDAKKITIKLTKELTEKCINKNYFPTDLELIMNSRQITIEKNVRKQLQHKVKQSKQRALQLQKQANTTFV